MALTSWLSQQPPRKLHDSNLLGFVFGNQDIETLTSNCATPICLLKRLTYVGCVKAQQELEL